MSNANKNLSWSEPLPDFGIDLRITYSNTNVDTVAPPARRGCGYIRWHTCKIVGGEYQAGLEQETRIRQWCWILCTFQEASCISITPFEAEAQDAHTLREISGLHLHAVHDRDENILETRWPWATPAKKNVGKDPSKQSSLNHRFVIKTK